MGRPVTCPVTEAICDANLLGRRAARGPWDHPAKSRRLSSPACTASARRRSFAGAPPEFPLSGGPFRSGAVIEPRPNDGSRRLVLRKP